jgi:hypothetical protein
VAFNNQSVAGTPVVLTTADLLDVSSVTITPNAQTTTDPRYTGSVDLTGDQLIGVSHEVSFEWLIHGPGAGTLPLANAFIGGRVLTALGFTENRIATAITGNYTAGTATSVTLDTGAAATAQLYKALALNVISQGASPIGMAMIQDYTAAKVATLARNRTLVSAGGTYAIPEQLAYTFTSAKPVAGASITVGDDQNDRQNFRDWRPTSGQIELVTAARDGGESYCKITVSGTCTLYSTAVEAVPAVGSLVPIPPFRDGQQDIANFQLGGASVRIDLGLRSAGPPNPNQLDGSDPAQIVETKRTVTYELNQHARATVDWDVIAKDQNKHPSQFLWGLGSGNYMGVMIDAQRFNYRTKNEGGDFMTNTGDAWIDGVEKCLALTFIKYL